MSTSNAQKTPLARSLNQWQRKAFNDQSRQYGWALPCHAVSASGAIITVSIDVQSDFTFPQLKVPLFGPQYIRYPIQPGDRGLLLSADTRLGISSGLGAGTPSLTVPGNLGALVFFPIGNLNWPSVDGNVLVMWGPNGVTLYDEGQNSTLVLTPTGIVITGKDSLTIQAAGASITLNSSGVSITGVLTINGHAYLAHEHSGVQSGGSNTGPVVP